MTGRRLDAAARRLVPTDWRDDVERDLEDERPVGAGPFWFATRAAGVGVRLRMARLTGRTTERGRRLRPASPRRSPMQDFGRDITFAVRGACRRPGYALAVIATLAIGIGANTAIFSVFNWILLRPLPGVVAPHELVTVRYQNSQFRNASFWVSHRDYADLRDGVPAFSALAASAPMKMDVSAGADAELLWGEVVTTTYMALFGVSPVLGRDFMPTEEHPGARAPAAIISGRLWRRAFGGDRSVLGRQIMLDGRSFTVVGVAPEAFQGRSLVAVTDVWIPVGAYPTLQPRATRGLLTSRQQTLFGDSFGRLAPGMTLAQAQDQATAVASNVPFAGRKAESGRPTIGPVLTAGIDYGAFTQERLTQVFWLLMGAVGLLLLLACSNAGNLLLARATGRRREIAVCQAIGASRLRIVRQQLAEALVLSATAGVAGLAVAVWLTMLFDGMTIVSSLPAVTGVGLDWRVIAFAMLASMLTAVAFATAPAIVSSRVDLQSSLKDGVTTSGGGRRWLRSTLVAAQVTVSVLLLVGAGLFIRTLQNLRAIDLGLDVDGVVSLSVNPSRYGYDAQRAEAYIRDLLERLRQAPGIESAAFTWTTPYSSNRNDTRFLPADGEKVSAATTNVSRDFFKTMKIPLVAGRDFTDADLRADSGQHGVVIVSQRLAKELFPAGGAVGSRVPVAYPEGKIVEVIGIAGDVRGRPLTEDPEPWAYLPAQRMTWGMIQARSSLPSAVTIATVRQVARAVDPVVMPYDVEPFGASLDRVLAEQRLFARTTGVFAAVAAVLAGIGIYGMMAGAVAERRKEFGIRLALGARAVSVLALVLRPALTLAVVGLLLGLGGAAAMRKLVEARLYGVTTLDPVTIAVAAASILLLSMVACLVPALRAARVDPVRSLRVE
ncbi:MAG: ABC transporter permease [Vicinamibacterales bacterium]